MKAAVYARFSTEEQSEASIEDQLRVCRRVAEREGFETAECYSDAAITGGTAQRPGYQRMLAAARRREFDAILAEDLKRLWREQAEQWRCIKELQDLGVHIITASGVDSRQANFEIIASVMGAAGELERKEAAYRTRRGLEGRARANKPTGGQGVRVHRCPRWRHRTDRGQCAGGCHRPPYLRVVCWRRLPASNRGEAQRGRRGVARLLLEPHGAPQGRLGGVSDSRGRQSRQWDSQ